MTDPNDPPKSLSTGTQIAIGCGLVLVALVIAVLLIIGSCAGFLRA